MNVRSGGSKATQSALGGIWRGCREVASVLWTFSWASVLRAAQRRIRPRILPLERVTPRSSGRGGQTSSPGTGTGDAGNPRTAACRWEPQRQGFGEPAGMRCVPEKGPFPLLQGVGGGEDRCRMLGVPVPPCTRIHMGVRQGKRCSEPKTSLYGSAEPAEVRSQAASCCTEAQLAAFLLLNGNARLRQKQPLVLTGRSLLAPASVWVDHFPFPGGFCCCLNHSAAKLVHPRLFLGGRVKGEAMETALCCEGSERWSKEGDGDVFLHRDHRSKVSVAVSSGYLPGPQMERGICSKGKESGLCLLYFFRRHPRKSTD